MLSSTDPNSVEPVSRRVLNYKSRKIKRDSVLDLGTSLQVLSHARPPVSSAERRNCSKHKHIRSVTTTSKQKKTDTQSAECELTCLATQVS